MKSIKTFLLAVLLLPLMTLSGCHNSEPTETIFTSLATLNTATETGCSFAVYNTSDGAPAILTSSWVLDAKTVTVGDRYLITYSNGTTDTPVVSGSINLLQITPVFNGDIQTASREDIDRISKDLLAVQTIYRTAQWLNIYGLVATDQAPRIFNVYVDESTIDDPIPDVFVVFDGTVSSTITSPLTVYGSFDISSVWDRTTCQAIRVYTDADHTISILIEKSAQ